MRWNVLCCAGMNLNWLELDGIGGTGLDWADLGGIGWNRLEGAGMGLTGIGTGWNGLQ